MIMPRFLKKVKEEEKEEEEEEEEEETDEHNLDYAKQVKFKMPLSLISLLEVDF